MTRRRSGPFRRLFAAAVVTVMILAPQKVRGAGRELLQDPGFLRGFRILAPTAGRREVLGRLPGPSDRGEPAWDLVQWHSRWPFTNPPALRSGMELAFTNAAKRVAMSNGCLTLGVDSRAEYPAGPRRSAAEPWVHLLAEQMIAGCPDLASMRSLRLRFAARLTVAETFRPPGYTPELHAAQFQIVVTLANTRKESPGFGDFLWFVVPLYDDRHPQPPRYVSRDFADPSAKLIFNPGAAAFTAGRLSDGKWVTVDRDLRPLLREALDEAWRRGYLQGSRDPADYRLTTLNVGWEVPGLNRVAVELRDLGLTADAGDR